MVFRQQEDILIYEQNYETIWIQPWGQDSLRVRAAVGPAILDLPGALLPAPRIAPEIQVEEEKAVLRNGRLRAEISKQGRLCFYKGETGEILLAEPEVVFHRPPARLYRALDGDLFHIEARFLPHPDERFYGLGQHHNRLLDQKGSVVELVQRNTDVCIPFTLSSRGYGFLWHNPALGRVELGANGTRWVAEGSRQIDYWLTAGDSYASLLASYADATGHPPAFPEWAAGFWQCKLRYASQEELLSVAREYRRRGLPLSVIVVDFFHWTMMGEWQFDPTCWPDPAGMVRELDEMGVRVMVSVWPTVNPNSKNYEEMRRRGLLVRAERGNPAHMTLHDTWPGKPTYITYYDPFNPEARAYLWEKLRQGYYRHGIKIWWLDACEPEIYPVDHENLRYHAGNGREVAGLYPLLHQQGVYEGMRAAGETEILTLCRSGWAGSQRYGAAIWSGDIPSTFESLQAQVRSGLNMGMSGIPWWTTDTGGFYGGNIHDPHFRELLVRWFQYSTFCPILRLHGVREPAGEMNGAPNEVWSFGEEVYAILRELLFLRERLKPYILEQMHTASATGLPPMRPLFFDFPGDPACNGVDDQFLFGPDLLVAPVLHLGERARSVYLPAGTEWTDAWSGARVPGGQWIQAAAPLDRIPVYIRGDRRLPIRPPEGKSP